MNLQNIPCLSCIRQPKSVFMPYVQSIALVLAAIFIAACGKDIKTNVVKSAAKNAFAGQNQFSAQPILISDLQVDGKSEAEYIAKKSPKTIKGWEYDKSSLNEAFQKSLRERAAKAGITIVTGGTTLFSIRPIVSWIETGYYRLPAWNAVSRIKMNVAIVDAKGSVQEEIIIEDRIAFDAIMAPDSGGRLRGVARMLGKKFADYLKSRTIQ